MGHVLVRLVQEAHRLVQLPQLVSLQRVQEVSAGPCQALELGFLQPQLVQVLQVV